MYKPFCKDWTDQAEVSLLQACCIDSVINYYVSEGYTYQLEAALTFITKLDWDAKDGDQPAGHGIQARGLLQSISRLLPEGHNGDQPALQWALDNLGLGKHNVVAYTDFSAENPSAEVMVKYLQAIEASYDFKVNESLDDCEFREIHPLWSSVHAMADSVLITDKGHVNFGATAVLDRAGFNHRVEETDSCGPTRCSIRTRKGKIYYG